MHMYKTHVTNSYVKVTYHFSSVNSHHMSCDIPCIDMLLVTFRILQDITITDHDCSFILDLTNVYLSMSYYKQQ